MFVSVTPSFLVNNFTFTNLALPTIQGFTTWLPDVYQFPWHIVHLGYNHILFMAFSVEITSTYKSCQKWVPLGFFAVVATRAERFLG